VPASTSQSANLRLALLSNGVSPHNDNQRRITAALEPDGWQISKFAHDKVSVRNGRVYADGQRLADFDLVWMLGLGEREDFLDRCQILTNLPNGKMLNSAQSMLALHSKHFQLPHAPLTCSANNTQDLLNYTEQHPEITHWVIKPAAGSYGRGIVKTDCRKALEQALRHSTANRTYCVLQAYVEEIASGETRCLTINGEIIGSYLRIPDHDFLANLTQGARARSTKLDTQQINQVQDIARVLAKQGVRFAAIDMAFPYLIEVNIANPGGLATLARLEGQSTPGVEQRLAGALRRMLEKEI